MFNTIQKAANAFLGIMSCLPPAIYSLIITMLVLSIIALVIKMIMR